MELNNNQVTLLNINIINMNHSVVKP